MAFAVRAKLSSVAAYRAAVSWARRLRYGCFATRRRTLEIAGKCPGHVRLDDGAGGDLVAKFAEVFVPDFGKAGNQVFGFATGDEPA